ncbi:MAG: hypothetical protein ACWA45_06885 [Flavobacteriales bacterium]
MKKFITSLLICSFLIFSYTTSQAQEITKYDFIEIIVIQKANNSGKIKRLKVEEQSSLVGKEITIKEIESLKNTSDLLNYMNAHNWEFLDRKAVTEPNDPVWMSYIFRKQKI